MSLIQVSLAQPNPNRPTPTIDSLASPPNSRGRAKQGNAQQLFKPGGLEHPPHAPRSTTRLSTRPHAPQGLTSEGYHTMIWPSLEGRCSPSSPGMSASMSTMFVASTLSGRLPRWATAGGGGDFSVGTSASASPPRRCDRAAAHQTGGSLSTPLCPSGYHTMMWPSLEGCCSPSAAHGRPCQRRPARHRCEPM